MDEVVILSAARTPIGSFNGALASLPAPKLGAIAIAEVIRRAGISPDLVDEVIMGNVLPHGMGQAPARQAALGAGLPHSVAALTINKVCGSGLKAVMLASQGIMTGEVELVVAGGMESMSQAPYLLERARTGYRLGHGELIDSMIKDGLWDPYNDFHMGMCGELCAGKYGVSKEAQDEYAILSYTRSLESQREGRFQEEIVPVEVPQKKGVVLVTEDEEPKKGDLEKLPKLKPVFKKDGTITPGNAPSVNDGAAALVVTSASKAKAMGKKPLARIIGQATAGLGPEWFTIAPAEAIQKVLKKTGLTLRDIDLFEINEAFSVVALAVMQILGLERERVNVNGGAVSLGHPIGCSGARILTTLIYALKNRRARRGLAAICLGGGEAVAMVVEQV